MGALMSEFTERDSADPVPPRGERVAAFVEQYLRAHPGLSAAELAFRLKADKRDMWRLLNDRSVGWRLEDRLAAYFGDVFKEALFPAEHFGARARREVELERELRELESINANLERDRAARRAERAADAADRLVAGQDRPRDGPPGRRPRTPRP